VTRVVTGGVDTHADVHVVAVLDAIGGLLGVQEFPATPAGYGQLLGWLGGFGTVCLAGGEGTGSYGAGLARHLAAAGVPVVEVDRAGRQDRRRQGKSGPLDAVSAARAALSGRARGLPEGRDGQVEAIRALMVAKRTARAQRTPTIGQARSLILTGPDDIRTRFTRHGPAELAAELAALRPRPGSMARCRTLLSLREPGRRAGFLDGQLGHLDELIVPLVTARAPALAGPARRGPRHRRHARGHRGRPPRAAPLRTCLGAPVPPRRSPPPPGKLTRHRLNPGGDRQASHALYQIVITGMSSHPATRAHVDRRGKQGVSKKEIIRCLKRYAARQVHPHLRPPAG
jgi:transposase